MMKNNKGFAHIMAILVGVVALVLLLMVAMMAFHNNQAGETKEAVPDYETSVEENSISDETDDDTIESELNATVTGDFEEDLNFMEEEASEL